MYRHLSKLAFPIAFLVFCGSEWATAQNKAPISLGKINSADFELPKSKVVDNNSNAVIISDVGSLEFIGNENEWISYVFKKKTRIKILNKKGYDAATVKLRLYGEDNLQDKLSDFHASTYNIDNGQVIETKLSASDLFDEKLRKDVHEKRFTMPDAKEGSVIEYSYTITSYHYYYLPHWSFQSLDYPSLYSEFKIGIPSMVSYLTMRYGVESFYADKSTEGFKSLLMNSLSVNTVIHNHSWVMKDVPALKSETYLNEPGDYLDRVEFVLAQTYNGQDVHDVSINWKLSEDKLLSSRGFGEAIHKDQASSLYNTMKKICSLDGDDELAARQIYFYVRDNFTCIPNNDIYIENNLYDVNKLRKGNVAELNMLLIGMLRQRGINADPVILSTRDYGIHPAKYPVLEKMNYVICLARIGGKKIYLDATHPLLGFGKLPLACYNGHAQIIDEQHSGSVFFNSDDIKEQNITYVNIVNDKNDNGASGSIQSMPGYFKTYDLRTFIKLKGQQEYLKTIKLTYGNDVEITNLQIDSLNDLEKPVTINYDFDFKNKFKDDIIYFNPMITGSYKENPFTSTIRKYPVEMPYPVDDTYELSMEIPAGYKIDEIPKSVKVSFNVDEGFFEYIIQKSESMVQLRTHLKLNQATFAAQDYSSLRDFFGYVVKKQSEMIVFKKK
jgi:hypothetical protein